VQETDFYPVDVGKKLKEMGLDNAWKKKAGSMHNSKHYMVVTSRKHARSLFEMGRPSLPRRSMK
jgi:hypothetical protein